MMRFSKICVCVFSLCSGLVFANSEKNAKGAFVSFYGGPFVHKSDTVNGTDFANFTAVEIGTNYGKRKEFGLTVHSDTMETVFRQTTAKVKTEFTEFRMNYRNLWFLPTVYIGQGQLKASSDDPAVGEFADLI